MLKSNKKIMPNIFSLFSLQIVNYVIPLLTFPYLVRIIGIENFGLLAFVTSITTYFVVLSDYGFNLSATKQISDNRDSPKDYSRIFNEVLTVKLAFSLISFIVLTFFIIFFEFFADNYIIFYLTYGVVVGQTLFPVWFLQGVEDMKYIAFINFISKTFFTSAIFIFVNQSEDYWIVPLLTSLGSIAAGLFAFLFVLKKYNIVLKKPSLEGLVYQIKKGWHVFLSRVYVNLYTTTNIVILGFLTNNTVVGYYSVAEKVLQACTGLFNPVIQAFYPSLANNYKSSKDQFFVMFKKLNIFLIFTSVLIAVVIFTFSELIISVVTGEINPQIIMIFNFLIITIIISPFGPSFTNAILILGEARMVSRVVLFTMFLNSILIIPMILYFDAVGLAMTWVIGQTFHVILYFHEFKKISRGVLTKCVA